MSGQTGSAPVRGARCMGWAVFWACRHTAVYQLGPLQTCSRHLGQVVKFQLSLGYEPVEVRTLAEPPECVPDIEEPGRVGAP